MAYITEQNNYDENIYLIDTQDLVIGGPDGISNKQAKGLANRTNWLKLALETFSQAYNQFVQTVNTALDNLGNSSTRDVGSTAGTVAAGDDSRFYPIASNNEVKAGSINNKIVTPAGMAAKDAGIIKYKWEIGGWNIYTDLTKTVFHGNVIDTTKIIDIKCMIRDDMGVAEKKYPINHVAIALGAEHPAGSIRLDNVGFQLEVKSGSIFNSSYFQNTAINRGYIIVEYLP